MKRLHPLSKRFGFRAMLLVSMGLASAIAPMRAEDRPERPKRDNGEELMKPVESGSFETDQDSLRDARAKARRMIRRAVVASPKDALSMPQLEPLPSQGSWIHREDKPVADVKARETHPGLLYGTQSATQNMDLFLPNSDEPAPVLILVHGGAFLWGCSRGIFDSMIDFFVARGYAVASVNYRLAGEAKFPRAVNDVKAAVRFLRANAKKFRLDPKRFAIGGESAGAYLAAMVGLTANIGFLDGDNPENRDKSAAVSVVFDWYGPIDFIAMQEQIAKKIKGPAPFTNDKGEHPEDAFLGGRLEENLLQAALCNPENYIGVLNLAKAPLFVIQHGTGDRIVPCEQSEIFAKKLQARLGKKKVVLELIPNQDHGAPAIYSQENFRKMHELMQRAFKRAR